MKVNCNCAFCCNDKAFSLSGDLLKRISSGQAVLFAGAGISTENRDYCKSTLYDNIRAELQIEDEPDFPTLMTRFCEQSDGRIKLVSKIKERIDYFRSFRGFYVYMTQFHRALRPLYMFADVITTNWDDFFETEAGYEPFVYDQDLAFLESSERRLIKLHGSITNFGSIIATEADYKRSLKRLKSGVFGGYLKSLLASKTVIYIGYSLRDSNYLNLAKSVSSLMGEFARDAYIVSPYIDHGHLQQTGLRLTPIETDGTYFLE